MARFSANPHYLYKGIWSTLQAGRCDYLSVSWVDDHVKVRSARIPHPDEQRHRPLQGRPALPPVVNLGVLKFIAQADLQEFLSLVAHGRH